MHYCLPTYEYLRYLPNFYGAPLPETARSSLEDRVVHLLVFEHEQMDAGALHLRPHLHHSTRTRATDVAVGTRSYQSWSLSI